MTALLKPAPAGAKNFTLVFAARIYTATVDMKLLLSIEDAVGALTSLRRRLEDGQWTAADIVTVIHEILHAAGRDIDFMELGGLVIAEGVNHYRNIALRFCETVLD